LILIIFADCRHAIDFDCRRFSIRYFLSLRHFQATPLRFTPRHAAALPYDTIFRFFTPDAFFGH
jgi:hypothetical protein